MSIEKCKLEAERWLITAKDDLDTATILRKNNKFAHACFHAQQAAEKAVKAVWYLVDSDPWGHSIKKLIDDLEQVDINKYNILKKLERAGRLLDRFYIPTRYPNGLKEKEWLAAENPDPGPVHLDKALILARVSAWIGTLLSAVTLALAA